MKGTVSRMKNLKFLVVLVLSVVILQQPVGIQVLWIIIKVRIVDQIQNQVVIHLKN